MHPRPPAACAAKEYVTYHSFVAWFGQWIKYYLVPHFLRYMFYQVWPPCRRRLFWLHKRFVMLRCRVDSIIARKPAAPGRGRVSVAVALRRAHGKQSWLGDLFYWLPLPFKVPRLDLHKWHIDQRQKEREKNTVDWPMAFSEKRTWF